MTTQRVIIAYDITNNKARRKLVRLLDKYGLRLQKSVYLCQITKGQFRRMQQELHSLYFKLQSGRHHKDGKCLEVAVIPLCKCCAEMSLYLGSADPYEQSYVLL